MKGLYKPSYLQKKAYDFKKFLLVFLFYALLYLWLL